MSDYTIVRESKEILKVFNTTKKSYDLLCPILKVLQMRHSDIDTLQATRVVRNVLDDE